MIYCSFQNTETLLDNNLNYILFKQEFRLEKKPLVKSNLDFLISKVLNENFIKGKWESISNVKGVNALKEGESLWLKPINIFTNGCFS